ncbi:MAG: DUF4255 domain-containing protein [Candidatus Methanoperedens sp.]
MSDFRVIGDIGETLRGLLDDDEKWEGIEKPIVKFIKSPKEITDESPRIYLFLYQIVENIFLKNEEMRRIDDSHLRHPPMFVDLLFLVVPYTAATDESQQEKQILGKIMQIFYDNPVLSGGALRGEGLPGTDEEVRIIFNPLSLDELTKLWSAFHDISFRISLSYMVTPVRIDSEREERVKRVVSKKMGHHYMVPEESK